MKWMILIFLNFLFCAQLVGQVSRPDRNLLRGETYVIEVPKGWKRPSAVPVSYTHLTLPTNSRV